MKKVEIYTVTYCPYCIKAKKILTELNIPFEEIDITENEEENRKNLGQKYDIKGTVTVPQIIIGGKRIGGCDDLEQLVTTSQLEKFLQD